MLHQAQQAQPRLGRSLIDDTSQKLSVEKLMSLIDKADSDIQKLSKSGSIKPLEIIDITDESIVINNREENFKSIQIGFKPRGLLIAPGVPDLPPTQVLKNTSKMFLTAEKEREQLKKEIEAIDVEYYAKYMKLVKLQKEYARFDARVKNLIYLGATKLAYIGIMTYVGPLAISYFLNHLCAMAAPLGTAKRLVEALNENLKKLNIDLANPPGGLTKEAIQTSIEEKTKELAMASLNVEKLQSALDLSSSNIIMRFILEAFVGLSPSEMQEAEQLLQTIQANAIQIFSDPKSEGLSTDNFLQTAFGSLELFGYNKDNLIPGHDVSIHMDKFRLSVLNLRHFFIRIACGPLTPLLKSPQEIMEEVGHVLKMPEDTLFIKAIDTAKNFIGYETELGLLKYGLRGKIIFDRLTKAKTMLMAYYREYTYEINNVVGIFTGSNTQYDDPDYISKHFNTIVKRPFNSMSLRNGLVNKVENYFFGTTGGKSFNLFSSSSIPGDDKKQEGTAAKDQAAKDPATKGSAAEGSAAAEGLASPAAEMPHKTFKDGLWAFFDVGAFSSLFKSGMAASEKMFEMLKQHTIARFTPRNCIGTATGALFDTISHSISTQVQTFLPNEKNESKNENNEAYEQEMKEYEDGLRAYRLHLFKQGYSPDAIVNFMRETAVVSNPSYTLNAEDHSALEYVWIKVQRKARELKKSGLLSELFLLWGAGGTAHLFGLCASHFSKPARDSSVFSVDAYGFGPKLFIETFASYKTSNAELNTAVLAQKISNSYNEIYADFYDNYIRKPALNSDISKWLHKNIKQKSKTVVKKVTDRFYLSKYITYVWEKVVDLVFDTLINLPINIPNTLITNMQYDISKTLGLYDLYKPHGWRFIMDNLTLTNIQDLYTYTSIGLQSKFGNTEAVANSLAMLSLKNSLNARRSRYQVHVEGMKDLRAALGDSVYNKVLYYVDQSRGDMSAALNRLEAKRKSSSTKELLDELKQIQSEWEALRDSAEGSAKKYYETLLEWLQGQRLKELANQMNMSVENYITSVYKKLPGETNESLIALTKKNESEFIKYIESVLANGLYEVLKTIIGERSFLSHISIPLDNGQNFEIRDENEIKQYRYQTDLAFLRSLMCHQVIRNGVIIDNETLKSFASENDIVLTESDLKTLTEDIASLINSIPQEIKDDEINLASYINDLFDNSIEKLHIEILKKHAPNVKVVDLPFVYFKIGGATYKFVKNDESTISSTKSKNEAKIKRYEESNKHHQGLYDNLIKQNEELQSNMTPDDPDSDANKRLQAAINENNRVAGVYQALIDKNKKQIAILNAENQALTSGPRTLWEHAMQYFILEVGESEDSLSQEILNNTAHKLGFSVGTAVKAFQNIAGAQNYLSTLFLDNIVSTASNAKERVYMREELAGLFGPYFREETIDFIRMNQQLIASNVINSMVGSDGFDLLDVTKPGGKLYKILSSHIYLNPSFSINLASYAEADYQIENLRKQANEMLEKLKTSDNERYKKICSQLNDISSGNSTYLDHEFVPIYNQLENLRGHKNNAMDAALAALPDYVLDMLQANKKEAINKHLSSVNSLREDIANLKSSLESLKKCESLKEDEQKKLSEINDIFSEFETEGLHVNAGMYLSKTTSLSVLKQTLEDNESRAKILSNGCISEDKQNDFLSEIENFEESLDDIEFELSAALQSDGLNIGIFLTKINELYKQKDSMTSLMDAYNKIMSKYNEYKSSIDDILGKMKDIYAANLNATINEHNDYNAYLFDLGKSNFEKLKQNASSFLSINDGLQSEVNLHEQKYGSLSYIPLNTARLANESMDDYIIRLQGMLLIVRNKHDEIQKAMDGFVVFFAGLKSGVVGAKILVNAKPNDKIQVGHLQRYIDLLDEARLNGNYNAVLDSLISETMFSVQAGGNDEHIAIQRKILEWLKKQLSSKEKEPEIHTIKFDESLEVPEHLRPFVEDLSQEYASLKMRVTEYNNKRKRVMELQAKLKASLESNKGKSELSQEETELFEDLKALLKETNDDYNNLIVIINAYNQNKKGKLKAGKDLYHQYAKNKANTDSNNKQKYEVNALKQEKLRLAKLLTDMISLNDNENVKKIEKQINDLDRLIDYRELINTALYWISSLNGYHPNIHTTLSLLDTLYAGEKEIYDNFIKEHGDDKKRGDDITTMEQRVEKIIEQEYNIMYALRDSLYKDHITPIIDRAKALLARYNNIYYNPNPDYKLTLTKEMENHMQYLQDIIDGKISLMPFKKTHEHVTFTLKGLLAMNADLYDFVKQSNKNANVLLKLDNVTTDIEPEEQKQNNLKAIKNAEMRTKLQTAYNETTRLKEKLASLLTLTGNLQNYGSLTLSWNLGRLGIPNLPYATYDELKIAFKNAIAELSKDIEANETKITNLTDHLKENPYDSVHFNTEIAIINSNNTTLEQNITDGETNYSQTWGPRQTAQDTFINIMTTIRKYIVDTGNAETELEKLEKRYEAQVKLNNHYNMQSPNPNLALIKAQIEEIKQIIKTRNDKIDSWFNALNSIRPESIYNDTLSAFNITFHAECQTIFPTSLSYKDGAWTNADNTNSVIFNVNKFINAKLKENDEFFNHLPKAIHQNYKNDKELLNALTEIRRLDKCNEPAYKPLCDMYDEVFTEKTAPHPDFIGKKREDFITAKVNYYENLGITTDKIPGNIVELLTTIYDNKDTNQRDLSIIKDILLHAGATAEVIRGLTLEEAETALPALEKYRDQLSDELERVRLKLKNDYGITEVPKDVKQYGLRGKGGSNREKYNLQLQFNALQENLKNMVLLMEKLKLKINVLTGLENAETEAMQLTQEELQLLKGIVQQARSDQVDSIAQVDVYKHALNNVRNQAKLIFEWNKKTEVDTIDRLDLSWLHEGLVDTRSPFSPRTLMSAGQKALVGYGAYTIARTTAGSYLNKKAIEAEQLLTAPINAFITGLKTVTDPITKKIIEPGATFIINTTGAILGHITIGGKIVMHGAKKLGEEVYTLVKPTLDSAGAVIGWTFEKLGEAKNIVVNTVGKMVGIVSEYTQNFLNTVIEMGKEVSKSAKVVAKYLVDVTGKVIGAVTTAGEYIWNKGVDAADAIYTFVEPAINLVGDVIGYAFDKASDFANVVIDVTGKFIGMVADEIGGIVNTVGDVIGTLKSFVFDEAGKLIGRIKETITDAAGKVVKIVVNIKNAVVGYVIGTVLYNIAEMGIQWISDAYVDLKNAAHRIYELAKAEYEKLARKVKQKVIDFYEKSGLKTVYEGLRYQWLELKQAYTDVVPVTREHAQTAFRIEYIVSLFLEQNRQAIQDSSLSVKDLQSDLRSILRSKINPCVPTSSPICEKYANVLKADDYDNMIAQNANGTSVDYVTTFFLDIIYNRQSELSLSYIGETNKDIGSRITEFVNEHDVSNPGWGTSYIYAAVKASKEMTLLVLGGLIGSASFVGNTIVSKYSIPVLINAGRELAPTALPYAQKLLFMYPKLFIGSVSTVGGIVGGSVGFGYVHLMKRLGIIEGTKTQYIVGSSTGVVVGASAAAFASSMALAGFANPLTWKLASIAVLKGATITAAGVASIAVLSLFIIGAGLTGFGLWASDKAMILSYQRPGETDEQTSHRLMTIARRSFINMSAFSLDMPLFEDAKGFAIFESSVNKLTTLLNKHSMALKLKGPVFKKLFKDDKPLPLDWYKNTSALRLSEADIHTIIAEAMRIDSDLVRYQQRGGHKKGAAQANDANNETASMHSALSYNDHETAEYANDSLDRNILNFITTSMPIYETLYFYIFLSNFYLLSYNISPESLAFKCADEFASCLKNEIAYYTYNLLFEIDSFKQIQYLIPVPWSGDNINIIETEDLETELIDSSKLLALFD